MGRLDQFLTLVQYSLLSVDCEERVLDFKIGMSNSFCKFQYCCMTGLLLPITLDG